MPATPGQSTLWINYKGTDIFRVPGAYHYVTDRVTLDADGAPNAYHPNDTGIDKLAHAGYPNKGWKSVLVTDPASPNKPYIQKPGEPYPGYFVSMTTLKNPNGNKTSPSTYVDSVAFPYVVFPGEFYSIKGTGFMGDFAMVRNLDNGKMTAAIVADVGPSDAPLGEMSLGLATALGGVNPNPRNGSGSPRGNFQYVIFPKSHEAPAWPLSFEHIDRVANAKLEGIGGWPTAGNSLVG